MNCDKCDKEFGAPATLRIHQNSCTVEKEVEEKKPIKSKKK